MRILFRAICFLLLYPFCLAQTDGFAIRKISTKPIAISDEEAFVPKGPYRYLGMGAQMYAFVSDDGQHVLKFYRQNRAGHPLSFLQPVLPSPLKEKLEETVAKRVRKRAKDFKSFSLAYRLLKKETGLIALHLNATKTPLPVILYDKIGVVHHLDLSQMQWLVQRYAEPTYVRLKRRIEENDLEGAKADVSALVSLLRSRAEKGLYDKDPDLKTNFGFTSKAPIQFDIGRFAEDATRKAPDVYRDELIRVTDPLYHWLETMSPPLALHLHQEVGRP